MGLAEKVLTSSTRARRGRTQRHILENGRFGKKEIAGLDPPIKGEDLPI